MDTPEIFQRRLQLFLRRYDALAKAVGPLKAPQPNEISREVAGLLLLSANQCCIAASIIDSAENVAMTAPAPVVRVQPIAQTSRRGNLVVVPGTGESTFPFPDADSLVLNALARLSGGNESRAVGTGEPNKLLSANHDTRVTYVIRAMELDSIVRVPIDEGIPPSEQGSKTPSRDLLFGHTTQPQVCFLRDAERLVEQIPTRDGMYVIEFEVAPDDFLHDVLLERAAAFLDRAEQILSAAEALWPNSQPPAGSAVALPEEEKRYSTSAS